MPKIKVAICNSNLYTLFSQKNYKIPIGGAEVQLAIMAKHLNKDKNIDLSVISADFGQADFEKTNSIKFYKSTKQKENVFSYVKSYHEIWKTLKKVNADVYFAASFHFDVGIIAAFCKFYQKKFIYLTMHDRECQKKLIKGSLPTKILFKYGLKNADRLTAQHTSNQKLLKKNLNLSSILLKNPIFIKKSHLRKKNYLLWVGRIAKIKKPLILLKIAKKLPKENFVMIGQPNNDDLEKNFKSKLSELKNVNWIERVPFEKIQTYFDEAKLFICTSSGEGFPNTHLQSCLGKTPICTLNINPDKYLTKNNLGYIANGDLNKQLTQIKKLLKDKKAWQIKSENAFKYVSKEHDVNKIMSQFTKLIYQLYEEKN